jgi:hypothetical protein
MRWLGEPISDLDHPMPARSYDRFLRAQPSVDGGVGPVRMDLVRQVISDSDFQQCSWTGVAPAGDWLATYQRMIAVLAHVESTAASSHVCGPGDLVNV